MKRFLWMLLIFIFMFSLATLFADESQTKKAAKDEKVAIQKVDKKVSEMPKVKVQHNRVTSSNAKQVKADNTAQKTSTSFVKKPKALPLKNDSSE
jgi:hypothetical protein